MKPEEKIERAYEELRAIIDGGSESFTHEDAVQYLKDKLAQPELCKHGQERKSCTSSPMDCQCAIDAALAQPEQEKERCVGCEACIDTACGRDECPKGWPKAAQPEQEPLEYWNAVEGWVKIDEVREHFDSVGCGTIYKTAGEGREPLYITPPQRTWVGLTDEERKQLWDDWENGHVVEAVEAKLKEKNT